MNFTERAHPFPDPEPVSLDGLHMAKVNNKGFAGDCSGRGMAAAGKKV